MLVSWRQFRQDLATAGVFARPNAYGRRPQKKAPPYVLG